MQNELKDYEDELLEKTAEEQKLNRLKWKRDLCILTVATYVIVFLVITVVLFLIVFTVLQPIKKQITERRKTTPIPGPVDMSECGIPAYASDIDLDEKISNRTKRIIKGDEAVPHSYPWVVSLRSFKNKKISSHICTGSLIYENYVITAAHCLTNYTAKDLIVLVGLHGLEEFSNKNIFFIQKIWSHESFDKNRQISHDIAVLKLSKAITRSLNVSIVCLSEAIPDSERVVAAGWGSISDGFSSIVATNLQQTVLSFLNQKDTRCSFKGEWDPKSTYCMLDLAYKSHNELSNTCFGDSGGPIMGYKNGKWYLYGLVSYVTVELTSDKKKRCLPYYPSYSTKITTYYSWIMSKIMSNKSSTNLT